MDESINPGAGHFKTISVRGVGFAPKKTETLVRPPESADDNEGESEPAEITAYRVGNAAMKAAKRAE
jgi:hypothetical protein